MTLYMTIIYNTPMLKFEKPLIFDWNEGNERKNLLKHKVTNTECESLFLNLPLILKDERHSKLENRYWALGTTTSKKYLHVTFTMRGNKIRVISARSMSRKERKVYEKTKKTA